MKKWPIWMILSLCGVLVIAYTLNKKIEGLQEHVKEASPAIADLMGDFLDTTMTGGGRAGQDGTKEWITFLSVPVGNTVYAVDISSPDPSGSGECPSARSTCVRGPNPLWASSPRGMGSSSGSAIGVTNGTLGWNTVVFVATNFSGAAPSQGGVRIYALDATTRLPLWNCSGSPYYEVAYQGSRLPEITLRPNDIPGTPALFDRLGGGYNTDLFFTTLEGSVYRLQDIGDACPTARTILDGSSVRYTYPITAPVALYTKDGVFHLVAATGGVSWATVRQRLLDVSLLDRQRQHLHSCGCWRSSRPSAEPAMNCRPPLPQPCRLWSRCSVKRRRGP